MNKFTASLPALVLLAAVSLPAIAGDGVTLRVSGTDLKSSEGQLVIAVFDSKDDFLKMPVDEKFVAISDDLDATIEFEGLPAGTYAVAAYHDRNGDGKLNTLVGVPREDYGFSNDARSMFGPPSFRKASFEVGEEQLDIDFRIR